MNYPIASHTMVSTILMVASSGFPFVLAMLYFCRLGKPVVHYLFALAPLPALITSVMVQQGACLEITWIFFGGSLGIDLVGRYFLFFTSVVWLFASLLCAVYFKAGRKRDHFYAFFLLSQCGNLGLVLSQDMLTFYLFFALMSFSAYGLIVYHNDKQAQRAGRVYIALVVLGEVLLFAALAMLAQNAGTIKLPAIAYSSQNHLVLVLLFIGFGIKAGAMPLHFWLPLAHPVAPIPASAVLSGTMIKAGLLGWLRFLPLGQVALPEWGMFAACIGMFAAFYAALVGVSQNEPKTVLAYSSISQMGLITVALGCLIAQPFIKDMAINTIVFYSLHHALTKAGLFIGLGVLLRLNNHRGMRIFLLGGLLFSALSLSGLPLTSGAIAKLGLAQMLQQSSGHWQGIFYPLLAAAVVGTTILMARFLFLAWQMQATTPGHSKFLCLPWVGLVLAQVGIIWLGSSLLHEEQNLFTQKAILLALLPVSIGIILAVICRRIAQQVTAHPILRIPAGDIIVVFDWLWSLVVLFSERVMSRLEALCADGFGLGHYREFLKERIIILGGRLGHYERLFKRWTVVGTCYLALLLIFYLLCYR